MHENLEDRRVMVKKTYYVNAMFLLTITTKSNEKLQRKV